MTAEELKPIEFLECKYDSTDSQLRGSYFNLNEVLEIMEQYHEAKTKAEVSPNVLEFQAAIKLLRDLADIQNGAPLVQDEKEWNEIMQSTYEFLNAHEK